ncbi:MAG: hypothetical protein RJA20_1356 [Bacteroidota bacterium]
MKERKRTHNSVENSGLSSVEARMQQERYGRNILTSAKKNHLLTSLFNIVREPMFLLLAVACGLYFFLGDTTEAIMMLVSIAFVAGIEIFQETKSEKALEALREYTESNVRVLRDNVWVELPAAELVPDDIVTIGEGERVPADGIILKQNDFFVEEAVLTGESLPVDKKVSHQLFQGTTVSGGQGLYKITATGNSTELGKLGKSIEAIDPVPTPLQLQLEKFVRQMGIFGIIAFSLALWLNMAAENDFWQALLLSLTIAMALLPEEIPVAFTTFMALGSYRMVKSGILVKQPKTVESLGSATVICLDKTGTITENRMSVAEIISYSDDSENKVLEYAWWASEPEPFDAMEKAIEERMDEAGHDPRKDFHLVHEYPLSGRPPMMTHIWRNRKEQQIVACKGAVERVLEACGTDKDVRVRVLAHTEEMAEKGYRVLGVASAVHDSSFPEEQDDFQWKFEGIVAFYDPPKGNVREVFETFYKAGIRVMMITGDHTSTARNIARSVGLQGWELALTGQEVIGLEQEALRDAVKRVNVYARMFPDAKLRIVQALQSNGEIVAMSGDGVNDGPALKAAQIGVAMGARGTDIAKRAASLVLLNDDLGSMATAVEMGRRIYDNLRKAIRYIISIHLPIIMAVLVPLLFGWEYAHILLPLHVIFLELVMDPMAAIGFENEPAESSLMRKPPRGRAVSLFTAPELGMTLLQGIILGGAVLFAYRFALDKGYEENTVRAYVFSTMVLGNVFLTLTNRSYDYTILKTVAYKNPFMWRILALSLVMLGAVLYVPQVADLFRVSALHADDLGWCALFAFAGVVWFEIWKAVSAGVEES